MGMFAVTWPILNFGGANHNSGMIEAAIIKFYTHVGHIKLVVLGWPPLVRMGGSHERLKFWEINDNILNIVQDTDTVTMED